LNVKRNAVLTDEAKGILEEVLLEKETNQVESNEGVITKLKEAKSKKCYSDLTSEEIDYLSRQIILTTESSPVDLSVMKRLEIITAECVYGMNIFRDFFAAVRDLVGGRSGAAQKVLRDARKVSLSELKREALMLGADAVIGVKLDYSEISGGGKSQMLMIVASGTAVTLKQT
jgi:uncharacterized protein YbjQ (UPF0145 family)